MSGPWGPFDGDGNLDMPFCDICGAEYEWHDCGDCGGDGCLDWETLQFEDPLWFQPGDTEKCDTCDGTGGWHGCPYPETHARILKEREA